MNRQILKLGDDLIDLDIAEFIAHCETQFDLQRACSLLGERHGFRYFSVLRMPQRGETRLADIAIATNWPVSLISQYDENGLLEHSPVLTQLRKSTAPVTWNVEAMSRDREDGKEQLVQLFRKHGLVNGIYFSVHSVNGEQGVVSFSGDRPAATKNELIDLNYYSNLIFDRICRLAGATEEKMPTLSKREKECILWTSHGKTSYEIGKILGLSEHTINNYLANVCRKLGAVNRAHLVGIAVRRNILS